jgi:hypothetical protein
MNATEQEERRELKKTITSLEQKNARLQKKVEDKDRQLHRQGATINDLVEDKRKDQNKIEVLMKDKYSIDRESLT